MGKKLLAFAVLLCAATFGSFAFQFGFGMTYGPGSVTENVGGFKSGDDKIDFKNIGARFDCTWDLNDKTGLAWITSLGYTDVMYDENPLLDEDTRGYFLNMMFGPVYKISVGETFRFKFGGGLDLMYLSVWDRPNTMLDDSEMLRSFNIDFLILGVGLTGNIALMLSKGTSLNFGLDFAYLFTGKQDVKFKTYASYGYDGHYNIDGSEIYNKSTWYLAPSVSLLWFF